LAISKVTVLLNGIGLMLVLATRGQPPAANIEFLVYTIVIGITTCYTCFKITWPKLIMAWSGNKVVVTKLIADHNMEKTRKRNQQANFAQPSKAGASFVQPDLVASPSASPFSHVNQVDPETPLSKAEADCKEEETIEIIEECDEDDVHSTNSSVVLLEQKDPSMSNAHDVNGFKSTSTDAVVMARTPANATYNEVLASSAFDAPTSIPSKTGIPSELKTSTVQPPDSHRSHTSGASFGSVNPRLSARHPTLIVPSSRRSQASVGKSTSMGGRFGSILGSGSRLSFLKKSSVGRQGSMLRSGANGRMQSIQYNPKQRNSSIHISEDQAPPRRLLLRMVDVQQILSKANQTLLTGLSIDRADWDEIRDTCVALGDAFRQEVVFAWEEKALNLHGESLVSEYPMEDKDGDLETSMNPKKISWNPAFTPPSFQSDGTMERSHATGEATSAISEEAISSSSDWALGTIRSVGDNWERGSASEPSTRRTLQSSQPYNGISTETLDTMDSTRSARLRQPEPGLVSTISLPRDLSADQRAKSQETSDSSEASRVPRRGVRSLPKITRGSESSRRSGEDD